MRRTPGVAPLLLLCLTVVLVALGLARGVWATNLHNGVLGLTFTGVGAYLAHERPGQRLAALFLATGVVESVMFFGRQVGHDPSGSGSAWGAWLGVWPLAVGLGLTTLCILCFPDGRLPGRGWQWVVGLVLGVLTVCATLSALWPVEYDAASIRLSPPFDLPGRETAGRVWSVLAHPTYAACQVLWVAAVLTRARSAGAQVRRQLAALAVPVVLSLVALVVGLVGWGTPVPGLLAASLVPAAAGWAVVRGQQLASYRALTWLSRTEASVDALPGDLAEAVAEAVGASSAVVWSGSEDALVAAGVWPETDEPIESTSVPTLADAHHVRLVRRHGGTVGALTVPRHGGTGLSRSQERVLDGLASQAALVLDNLSLARLIDRGRASGSLDQLTPREREVLELMARGLSNAAICQELHLSVKTVEPAVGAIFTKLGLPQDSSSNRRVLAVVELLRHESPTGSR